MKGVDLSALAKLAEEYGVALNTDEIESVEEVTVKRETERVNRMVQMEGVLTQLHHKHALTHKVCGHCKQAFQTNYCYVDYCSDSCRNEAFRSKYGISWESLKVKPPQSFWEYEDVIILPPALTTQLYEYAKFVVDEYEGLMQRSRENQEVLRQTELEEIASLAGSVPEFSLPEAVPEPYTPHSPSEEEDGPTQSAPSLPDLGQSDPDSDFPAFSFPS